MVTYEFILPFHTPTLNELLRMHWRSRQKRLNEIAWHFKAQHRSPQEPLQRARVIVERYTTGNPDPDGIRVVAKAILDVLQPCSKKHPLGLGFIADDSSKCIDLEVRTVVSKEKRTRILVMPL